MRPLAHIAFGVFVTASFFMLFVMPAALFGECTLRWSSPCTTEESLAHIEKLRQLVLKDVGK
jgi:hypothetical protein